MLLLLFTVHYCVLGGVVLWVALGWFYCRVSRNGGDPNNYTGLLNSVGLGSYLSHAHSQLHPMTDTHTRVIHTSSAFLFPLSESIRFTLAFEVLIL